MVKKLRSIEKRFYELIGIKLFRKMAFGLVKLHAMPKIKHLPEEERKRILSKPSNYNMKKGNGIQDLQDFKEMLFFNASVHFWSLCFCIIGLMVLARAKLLATWLIIPYFVPFLINMYCIMLQRYNHIRINEAIEKYEEYQELKKKRQKRLEKEKNNTLSLEKVNELVNIFSGKPQVVNSSLKDEGYMKIVDIRSYLPEKDPLSVNYWLNNDSKKVKTLTRKVG